MTAGFLYLEAITKRDLSEVIDGVMDFMTQGLGVK